MVTSGDTFDLLTFEEAKKKIPDGYTKEVLTNVNGKTVTKNISLKSYFSHELFSKTNETELTIDYT
jgi:hypothetical protein